MSQFTCVAFTAQLRGLFGNCYWVPSVERQKQSREKLEHQKSYLAYERKQIESQIEECERRKAAYIAARRVREAKDVVREKHKLIKKLDKTRELFDFTENLLEQIIDASTVRETLSTINEAQQTFMRINPTTIYNRYAKMADKFSVMQEQVADTQEMINSSLSANLPNTDDAELLAELESCDTLPASSPAVLPPAPIEAPQGLVSAAYARAGMQAWN